MCFDENWFAESQFVTAFLNTLRRESSWIHKLRLLFWKHCQISPPNPCISRTLSIHLASIINSDSVFSRIQDNRIKYKYSWTRHYNLITDFTIIVDKKKLVRTGWLRQILHNSCFLFFGKTRCVTSIYSSFLSIPVNRYLHKWMGFFTSRHLHPNFVFLDSLLCAAKTQPFLLPKISIASFRFCSDVMKERYPFRWKKRKEKEVHSTRFSIHTLGVKRKNMWSSCGISAEETLLFKFAFTPTTETVHHDNYLKRVVTFNRRI